MAATRTVVAASVAGDPVAPLVAAASAVAPQVEVAGSAPCRNTAITGGSASVSASSFTVAARRCTCRQSSVQPRGRSRARCRPPAPRARRARRRLHGMASAGCLHLGERHRLRAESCDRPRGVIQRCQRSPIHSSIAVSLCLHAAGCSVSHRVQPDLPFEAGCGVCASCELASGEALAALQRRRTSRV